MGLFFCTLSLSELIIRLIDFKKEKKMNHREVRSSQGRKKEDIVEEKDLIRLYKGEKRLASHKGQEK